MSNTTSQDEIANHLHQLYLIDASIYIFRYFFAMPAGMRSVHGRPTETVYGFARWLCRLTDTLAPQHVALCFDESLGSGFRHQIYAGYKSSRAHPDDDLAFQLLACKKVGELMGLACYASDTHEADDLIGTLAQWCAVNDKPYTVLSRDKDLAQVICHPAARLWDFPDGDALDHNALTELMGVRPAQVADFLALMGDPGDDIPGVPGVGKKTAAALLSHFDSWAQMRDRLDDVAELPVRGARSLVDKLKAHRDQVDMALRLSTIVTDAMAVDWRQTRRRPADVASLVELGRQLGFPPSFVQPLETLPQ